MPGSFHQYFQYLRNAVLSIPFVAIVGDYLVRGVFQAGLAENEEAPTFSDTALAVHSLAVLYVLGAMVMSSGFRRSRGGQALVATVVLVSAVRVDPSGPTGRSRLDMLGYIRRTAAAESANLSVREYEVADSLGWRGRPTMWFVSAHARTKNMFVLQTEKYNAMLHCTWQCHYTQYENVSVALAFGNAHEAGNTRDDGTVQSIGDTIADRINNEVARRYGSELARDYQNFFGAVATSVTKAIVDMGRDKLVRLARKIPVINWLTLLDDLHKIITLDGRVITTPCDDICERAFNEGQLAKAREGEGYLSGLTPEEVEENYIKPLLFLLSTYGIRPTEILPPNELLALQGQAKGKWGLLERGLRELEEQARHSLVEALESAPTTSEVIEGDATTTGGRSDAGKEIDDADESYAEVDDAPRGGFTAQDRVVVRRHQHRLNIKK